MLLLLLLSLVSVHSQMIPQCPCSTFEPCFAKTASVVEQCADRCRNQFTSLGADYNAARACIMSKIGPLRGTLSCARSSFGQVCGSGTVPKRHPETVQLAAFREISGMMSRSGIGAEASGLLQVGRKAIGCIVKCVQSQSCARQSCGLALPGDNQIVSTVMGCARQSGLLSTASLRDTCSCLSRAGLRQLTPLCPRLTIS